MNNIEEKQMFVNNIFYHFNLRQVKEEKPTPIYLVVRLNGKQYKYPIGCKVLPSQWSKKMERPIISSYISRLDNKNNSITHKKIQATELQLKEIFNYLCSNPDEENVLEVFNSKLNNKKNMTTKNNTNVILDLRKLIEDKRIKDSSKRQYQYEMNMFEKFIEERNGSNRIDWDSINLQLLLDYQSFLSKQTVKHRKTGEEITLEENTIQQHMIKIYTIFKDAEKVGLIDLMDTKIYKLKDDKKKKDKTYENQIYLTDEELDSMKSLLLTGIEEQVRDLFVFQCEIGQRFEDINGISPIIEGDKIRIFQKKTGKSIYAPLTDYCLSIISKYEGKLPKIANSIANKHLKAIGKKANINRMVECNELRDGKNYSYQIEAYKMIGTHTARRSFISNELKDTDSAIIKKVTGHTTDSAFNRYNRLNSIEASDIILKNRSNKKEETQPINQTTIDSTLLDKLEKTIRENERLKIKEEGNKPIEDDDSIQTVIDTNRFDDYKNRLNKWFNMIKVSQLDEFEKIWRDRLKGMLYEYSQLNIRLKQLNQSKFNNKTQVRILERQIEQLKNDVINRTIYVLRNQSNGNTNSGTLIQFFED